MNTAYRQGDRLGRLSTVLGSDVLVLLGFAGADHLNGLFDYSVDALSTNPNLDFDKLIGTHATVEVETIADGPRAFDGIVTQAVWAGVGDNGNKYKLTLRPWFWLAGLRRNQRIFHDKTVVQILEELLKDYSDTSEPHLSNQLQNDYRTLEYTVQYRESDLAFACRLMERFGITYHFSHKPGSHTMLLTDVAEAHQPIAGDSRPYRGVDGHHQSTEEHFWEWHPERNVTTGAILLTDWNFKSPGAVMEAERPGEAAYANGKIESFDYPGDYLTQSVGKDVARLRMDQERAQDVRHRAIGDCASLQSGMTLKLTGDQVPGVKDAMYLCLSARHSLVTQGYGTGGSKADEYPYTGEYVFAPLSAPLAPPRVTPVPVVHGPQTAMVVGEGEIDCDELGRILVRFHWDLNDAYSMRCRVSQNWAGLGWGGMVIPRIGMEVVVEFIEGDPDQPLVTGCVYNGKNTPPAALPDNKSRSVFKTKSHEGEGFNELTFEDQSGEEFIYLHAQKNLDVHVENSAKRRVEFDDNVSVGNASNLDVAADRTETIEGKLDLKVTGPIAEKTEGDRGADVGGSYAIKTGGDLTIKASGEIVLDASKITLVSGGAALTVQGGAVNVAPMLNVGSASPGAAAIPAIPAILKAAVGAGSPFVSHCPLEDGGE